MLVPPLVIAHLYTKADEAGRGMFGQQAYPGRRRVQTQLQGLQVQAGVGRQDDLAVDNTPRREFGLCRLDELGE